LLKKHLCVLRVSAISDHQQSWGYEDGPLKGPGPSLLVAADFLKEF
jgi:hypothetical protein